MNYPFLQFMMKVKRFEAPSPQCRFNFIIISMELVKYSRQLELKKFHEPSMKLQLPNCRLVTVEQHTYLNYA